MYRVYSFNASLEDLLQRNADLVSERALHWKFRDRVLAEQFNYKGRWILPDVFL
jgi:predicted nucleotidyltransferase